MSLLSTAARLNAANQLNAWNSQAISLINQASAIMTSINAQKTAMASNSDFSSGDIAEVQTMITDLKTLATVLTV